MSISNKKEEGKIWVCQACGKWAETELGLWDKDESCGMHGIKVDKDKVEFREDGRVKSIRS